MHPYATELYARSLGHVGTACLIPEWDMYVLARDIPGGGVDAVGTYPIAMLAPDADLSGGLARLKNLGFVAVTLVLDDFHRPALIDLQRHFDVVEPFKTHYLRRNASPFAYGRHHRYEVARAHRTVSVDRFELGRHLADWMCLYETLIRRHGLSGVHAFDRDHFAALHAMPNVSSIGAWSDGELLAAHIWVRDERFVHSHLAASSADGYKVGAAYAIYDESVRLFADAEIVNFGGASGAFADATSGLARFKSGFSNATADAYICGAILDQARYATLSAQCAVSETSAYFPAYRHGRPNH